MSDIVKGLVLWKNMTIGEKTDFICEGNSKATGNFTDQKKLSSLQPIVFGV